MRRVFHLRLLLVWWCLGMFAGCGGDVDVVAPGKPARDFRLDTLTRDRFYLNQHRGQVVVLVFWATWCASCKQELAALQPFVQQYPQEKLLIAAICTNPENLDTVKAIAQDLGLTYPVLLDRGAKVFQQYHQRGYPATIIIDQEGIVSFVRPGYSPTFMKQIKMTVENLLSSESL